jgi:hypothetical protein
MYQRPAITLREDVAGSTPARFIRSRQKELAMTINEGMSVGKVGGCPPHNCDPCEGIPVGKFDCCPSLYRCDACDELDFRYRLPFRPVVVTPAGEQQIVPVEVTLRFRLQRCNGPLTLGNLLYTTTLLPGEKVRLLTRDQNTRFSFDNDQELASRQYTTSEESYFLAGMARSMSNLTVVAGGELDAALQESAESKHHYDGINLGFLNVGGSVSASSYDANAASTFARYLSQHAETASRHVEVSAHAQSSTSIAEVASRSHAQGQSEDHYEAASRVFSNPNRCHALTFLFYRIDKCQKVRFSLVAVDRRVDDPASPTGVQVNPLGPAAGTAPAAAPAGSGTPSQAQGPIAADVRANALSMVDDDLRSAELLNSDGQVSQEALVRFFWERTLRLPTPGVIVKSCLDECDACEASLEREIELDLEAKELENKLLQRKIDLLEKSQEYRCCPGGAGGEADAA